MKIKIILCLFLLTSVAAMPYASAMEESTKTQRSYEEIKKFFDSNLDIFEALKILREFKSSSGLSLPNELIWMIMQNVVISNKNGQALLTAIENDDIDQIKQLLKKQYITIDLKNKRGKTSLILASVLRKDPERAKIVQILLRKGTNPDLQDNIGESALHYAVKYNLPEMVKILLKNGANLNLQNNEGRSALWWAIRNEYTELVQNLLEKGANPDFFQIDKWPVLCYAVRYYPKIAQMLLENGANIHLQNESGETALHLAVLGNNSKIVRMLLKKGANPNLKDNDGRSALDLAKNEGLTEIAQMLQGASENKLINL